MHKYVVETNTKCPKLPWMIDFHSTEDGKIWNSQLKAAFAKSNLSHLCNLYPRSKISKIRLTQLVCIIPPNVHYRLILDLLEAGMAVALLKSNYFTLEECRDVVAMIHRACGDFDKKIGYHCCLAIAFDVSAPEILTSKPRIDLQEIELTKGQVTKLTSNPSYKNHTSKEVIYVDYENFKDVVKPGDSIVIGDGDNAVSLSAQHIARDIVECIVERAGKIIHNMSLKLPNTPTIILTTTESQQKFLELGQELEVGLVFVPPLLIQKAKETIENTVLVVGKIESQQVIDDIDDIINVCDGIFVDTDKLVTNLNENVFIVQKAIVAKCNKFKKPVMVPMTCNTINKSQIFDVANAVIDGIDAVVMPPDIDVVNNSTRICKAAEASIYQKQLFENLCHMEHVPVEPNCATAIGAVEMSLKSNAAAIIIPTTSGRSAKLIAAFRPRCPIIALTRYDRISRQLHMYRGIIPLLVMKTTHSQFSSEIEARVQLGITFGKFSGFIHMGDALVIVTGVRPGAGFTNNVKVVYASEYDTQPEGEPKTQTHLG